MRLDNGVLAAGSGVSWSAILAGATAAAALALILLTLGVGLGFAVASPWATRGASATAIGTSAIIWLIVVHIVAAAIGGYLAGRLRTRWVVLHTDEVYFRDTAHGLLAWSVATLVTAAFLASAAGNAIGIGARVAGAAAGAAGSVVTAGIAAAVADAAEGVQPDGVATGTEYFATALLRSSQPATPTDPGMRREVGQIFGEALRTGTFDPADRVYLAQVIAARTGITAADAEKRIDETFGRARAAASKARDAAREAADAARKAAAYTALWTFVALLSGAFVASLAATWGGRRRDLDSLVVSPSQTSVRP